MVNERNFTKYWKEVAMEFRSEDLLLSDSLFAHKSSSHIITNLLSQ